MGGWVGGWVAKRLGDFLANAMLSSYHLPVGCVQVYVILVSRTGLMIMIFHLLGQRKQACSQMIGRLVLGCTRPLPPMIRVHGIQNRKFNL